MTIDDLPLLNSVFNATALALLIAGYVSIRQQRRDRHRNFMVAALVASALFLTSYLIYHLNKDVHTPYPLHDWTRPLYYFVILIPHIILAALMTPFIIALVVLAFTGRFAAHKRLARWVWPVWVYVSLTGILVYVMLHVYGPWRAPEQEETTDAHAVPTADTRPHPDRTGR